jgi:hypothetical protein
MGWSGGSIIFSEIIKAAKKHIPDDTARRQFYSEIYETFCDGDWDTEDECFDDDPIFKEMYDERWNA